MENVNFKVLRDKMPSCETLNECANISNIKKLGIEYISGNIMLTSFSVMRNIEELTLCNNQPTLSNMKEIGPVL